MHSFGKGCFNLSSTAELMSPYNDHSYNFFIPHEKSNSFFLFFTFNFYYSSFLGKKKSSPVEFTNYNILD